MIWIRRLGLGLGVLLGIAVIGVALLYAMGVRNSSRTWDIPVVAVAPVPADSARLARGRHLADAIAKCTDCHGPDLAGGLVADAGPLGVVWAPNITRGGVGSIQAGDDAAFVRAVRHGVSAEGRPLAIMPSSNYAELTEEDLLAILAYTRSLPASAKRPPVTRLKPLGMILYAAGRLPIFDVDRIDHRLTPVARIEPDTTATYGGYLAVVGGCTGCHGPSLSGGPIPGGPPDWRPAANITPTAIGKWTFRDFDVALREGKRPDGSPVDTLMPWKKTRLMDGMEMRALWAYVRGVPGKEYGGR
ncbi:MAG: cytochrome c [Gemmatimonadota bacterium]